MPAAPIPGAPTPDPAAPTPDPVSADESDAEIPEVAETTAEQQAGETTQEQIRELLVGYQRTLDRVDDMPAVIWMSWARSGPGHIFKMPYLRLFLRFFVSHHVNRNLNALQRRLQSAAALAEDPDANKRSREMVKYFQQSLPAPPYRTLVFAAIAAALVIALPLQAVGNVFYVLDLVGALLRLDVGYAGRAFASKELAPTLRSLFVLLVGLVVVAGVLTSPFGLNGRCSTSIPGPTRTSTTPGRGPTVIGSTGSTPWRRRSSPTSAPGSHPRDVGISASRPRCWSAWSSWSWGCSW